MMEAVDITNLSFNILADDGMSNEDLYCGMWYLAYITLILKLSTARIAKKYRFLICGARIALMTTFPSLDLCNQCCTKRDDASYLPIPTVQQHSITQEMCSNTVIQSLL